MITPRSNVSSAIVLCPLPYTERSSPNTTPRGGFQDGDNEGIPVELQDSSSKNDELQDSLSRNDALLSTPCNSTMLTTAGMVMEYEVVLEKVGDAKLGLSIQYHERQNGPGISIGAITGGVAAEWNANADESEQIVPGDEIVEVNGFQGDTRSMVQKCMHEKRVHLVLTACSAQRLVYQGQWEGNVWHGKGVLNRPDGSQYDGQFADGRAHGEGRFCAANGNKYEGQWEKNSAHGFGKYTYTDGAIYEGSWHQNSKSGKGKQTGPDGFWYEGEFSHDARHGVGCQRAGSRIVYDGQWRMDKFDGEGKYTCSDGLTYTGQWQNGQMGGRGKLSYPSGSTYEGSFQADRKHGDGIFIWPDGRVYAGQWRLGKQDGTGTMTDRQGVRLGQGVWRDGQRVK